MFRKSSILLVLLFAGWSLTAFSRPLSTLAEEEGPPWWVWLLVALVLFAFAAFVVWWWRRSGGKAGESVLPVRAEPIVPPQAVAVQAPAPKMPAAAVEAPASTLPSEPSVAPVPSVVEGSEAEAPPPDDLKLIEGIGPRLSAVLQAAGITTFARLAATDVDRLRTILEHEDPRLLRLADPTTWPEQARLAAAAQWEALEKLQGELKGGRRA